MKIKMYEVREDEKKAIERVAEELGADVSISSNILTPQEAESLRGIDGVSILGRTTVNKELLSGMYSPASGRPEKSRGRICIHTDSGLQPYGCSLRGRGWNPPVQCQLSALRGC